MNRLVCDCVNVYEDEIEKSFLKNKGNLEFVIEETQATLAYKMFRRELFKSRYKFS